MRDQPQLVRPRAAAHPQPHRPRAGGGAGQPGRPARRRDSPATRSCSRATSPPTTPASASLLQAQKGSSDDWRTIGHGRDRTRLQLPDLPRLADPRRPRRARRVPRRPPQHRGRLGHHGRGHDPADPGARLHDQHQRPDRGQQLSRRRSRACCTSPGPPRRSRAPRSSCSGGCRRAARSRRSARTTTGTDGSYSFTVQTTTNELYQVRTVSRAPAPLGDAVRGRAGRRHMTASSQTSTVGGQVTFTGDGLAGQGRARDLPAEARQGRRLAHGRGRSSVQPSSTFSFGWTFGTAGHQAVPRPDHRRPGERRRRLRRASTIVVSQPPLSSLPTG